MESIPLKEVIYVVTRRRLETRHYLEWEPNVGEVRLYTSRIVLSVSTGALSSRLNRIDPLSPSKIVTNLSFAEYSNILGNQGSNCGSGTSFLGKSDSHLSADNTNIMRLNKPKSS